MGTLGCINDMLRRDKENRELRKRSRERMQETRKELLDTRKMQANLQLSAEEIDSNNCLQRRLTASERK